MSVSNHFFDMVIGANSDTAVSSNHDKESTSVNKNETISPDGESVNDESAIKNTIPDPMPWRCQSRLSTYHAPWGYFSCAKTQFISFIMPISVDDSAPLI